MNLQHFNLQQLNPWNWFKHEDFSTPSNVPIKRNESVSSLASPLGYPIVQLQHEIDELFQDVFRSHGFPSRNFRRAALDSLNQAGFQAKVNVASDDKSYRISLEVPGLTENDISLELNQDTLIVRGEKKEDKETKDLHYYRIEHSYGSFQRVLALPDDADKDNIAATIKHGVLDITLPRKALPASASKHIPINS